VDVASWLRELGLGQYEQAFNDNAIDGEILPRLTADDLKDLGVVAIGHRRRVVDAIDALRVDSGAPPPRSADTNATPSPAVAPATQAERRQLTVMFVDLVGSTALSRCLDPRTCARSRGCTRTRSQARSRASTGTWPS
jgi:class 3 adenylate cyclase